MTGKDERRRHLDQTTTINPMAPKMGEGEGYQVPAGAIWFGVEILDGDDWIRLDDEVNLGGRWWKLRLVNPRDIQALGQLASGSWRIIWTGPDRRKLMGRSPPVKGEPSPPLAPKGQATGVRHPGVVHNARYRGPSIEGMPLPAPGTSDPLTLFLYFHNLVKEDKRAHEKTLMGFCTTMMSLAQQQHESTMEMVEAHYESLTSARGQAHERSLQLAERDSADGLREQLAAMTENGEELDIAELLNNAPQGQAEKILGAIKGFAESQIGQQLLGGLVNKLRGDDLDDLEAAE